MDCEPSLVMPYITFLISTHNRRAVLLETLAQLADVERASGLVTETIVVDNASSDGTADAVANAFPQVTLLRNRRNAGACSKNDGLTLAQGRFVMFLDDDSHPTADSLERMIDYFEADASLGAAIFDIRLPDGRRECSAYPSVFIGCGTAFRREAIVQVGGLPSDFFMQAEEYDLSLRLMEAGWELRRFDDLIVHHRKTSAARRPARTMRLDVRNNLCVITRHFPRQWMLPFALDWMRRYRWIAKGNGWRYRLAFWTGLGQGIARSLRPGRRRAVSLRTFERFAMPWLITRRLSELATAGGWRTILLIDVGKNILPFALAAQACGLTVVAVADDRLARPARRYRGIAVVDDATAQRMAFDAAVVANVSPVHAAERRATWQRLTRRPVVDLLATATPPTALAA